MRKTWAEIRANLDGLRWLTKDKLAAYTGEVGQAWTRRKHRSLYDNIIEAVLGATYGFIIVCGVAVLWHLLFKK